MKRITEFTCPVCNMFLVSHPGTRLRPTDGYTVWCENSSCPAEEVMGYGKDEKAAYEIVKQRFSFRTGK